MNNSTLHNLNRLRWADTGKPFFEVYYLRFHDPHQRLAGWFRFVLRNVRERAPDLSIWATLFDLESPAQTVHLHDTFPLRTAQLAPDRMGLRLGDCGFTTDHWWGTLRSQSRQIQWDLRLTSDAEGFLHLRRPLYDWNFVPMKVLSPHFRTSIAGTVQVTQGGTSRQITIQHIHGNASHYWGYRLVDYRVWGFCQTFKEDPEFGFEGASGIASLMGIPLPRTTFLCFRYQGRLYELNSPLRTLLNRSEHDLLSWHFVGHSAGPGERLRFEGLAQASDVSNMVAHRWESPDGDAAREQYIHLDSTANLHIEVSTRRRGQWQAIHQVTAERMAAFETSLPALDTRVTWVER